MGLQRQQQSWQSYATNVATATFTCGLAVTILASGKRAFHSLYKSNSTSKAGRQEERDQAQHVHSTVHVLLGSNILHHLHNWVSKNRSLLFGSAWILVGRPRSTEASVNTSAFGALGSDILLVAFLWSLSGPDGRPGSETEKGKSNDRSNTNTNMSDNENTIRNSNTRSLPSVQEDFLNQIHLNLGLPIGPDGHPLLNTENKRPEDPRSSLSPPKIRRIDPNSRPPQSQSQTPHGQQNKPPQQRYLEILVHNVSHTDMVLGLDLCQSSLSSKVEQDSRRTLDEVREDLDEYALCRPRFSAFDDYSRRVQEALTNSAKDKNTQPRLVSFPRYERSPVNQMRMHRYSIDLTGKNHSNNAEEPHAEEQNIRPQEEYITIGFALGAEANKKTPNRLHVSDQEMHDLRVRGKDVPRVAAFSTPSSPIQLSAVFFPLLAMLLPQWESQLHQKYNHAVQDYNSSHATNTNSTNSSTNCKKVLILVSGVGSPRNWTHSMDGNSTEICAQLMQAFIQRLHKDWVVVCIHSKTNIFRYDENISFVKTELMPCIEAYRDAHAKGLPYPDEVQNYTVQDDGTPFDPDWRKTMSLTLSFADGSPARTHAIQAALRPYRPTYFHCWQLKTFWHESKIVYSDLEVHSFEEMETLPPLDADSPQFQLKRPLAWKVVQEVKAFREEFQSMLQHGNHDLYRFWLRKTRKAVLAVLAVQTTPDGPIQLYRGTNMEVSMPTGSLCAERNVIGTALAANPHLKRHHLKMIAVLSAPSPTAGSAVHPNASTKSAAGDSNNSSRVSLSRSTGSLTSLLTPATSQPPSRSSSMEVINSLRLEGQEVGEGGNSDNNVEGWILQEPSAKTSIGHDDPTTADTRTAASPGATPVRRIPLFSPHGLPTKRHSHSGGGGGVVPDERVEEVNGNRLLTQPTSSLLVGKDSTAYATTGTPSVTDGTRKRSSRKTVILHSSSTEDLNPLKPCGACNEWLKKIAETNPYFQIMTFTDADCAGVYCHPCAED